MTIIKNCMLGLMRDCNCSPEECETCGWNPVEFKRRAKRVRAGNLDDMKPGSLALVLFGQNCKASSS